MIRAALVRAAFVACTLAAMDVGAARGGEIVPPLSDRFAADGVAAAPDFRRHVLPLLSRLGCNGRACHGSFQGQGGFKLSLFGYDFAADLASLTDQREERVKPAQPSESLILRKPSLQDEHEGGKRFAAGGWEYRVLARWIAAGAPGWEPAAPELVKLEVEPASLVAHQPGQQQSLRVLAQWTDGTREDVTCLARFRSNDESIATVDPAGRVTVVGKGDTHVVAFYDNGVLPVSVLLPVSDRSGANFPVLAADSRIDQLVYDKLRLLGCVPSELSGDAEFLRRVTLDVTGLLPTASEVTAFLADVSPDKRARTIDELLARPAHAAWWTTRLCDFTGNNPQSLTQGPLDGNRAAAQWYAWLFERVRRNVPYDQIVEAIVLARGRRADQSYDDYCRQMSLAYVDPCGRTFAERESLPHFWMRRNARTAEELSLSFAHAFLGIRLQCAQCHKHPFDQWTKQDFDQFAAFFRRVSFGAAPDARRQYQSLKKAFDERSKSKDFRKQLTELIVAGNVNVPWQEVFLQPPAPRKDNRPANRPDKPGEQKQRGQNAARLLAGEVVDVAGLDDPRRPLMDWLRRDAERHFARAYVNRVWASYFGVGIVDPPDDFNLANPASNAPLLDDLTREFVGHGFDMRWLHREILLSRTYQTSSAANATNRLDERNFSRRILRRLPAEVTYNALVQATANDAEARAFAADVQRLGTGPGQPAARGQRPNYLLTVFGKPSRASNCDCERSAEPSLLQTLYLRNDQELLSQIERGDGWLREVSRQLDSSAAPAQAEPQPAREDLERRLAAARRADDRRRVERLTRRLEQLRRVAASPLPSPTPPPAASTDLVAERERLVRQAYLRVLSRPAADDELARAMAYLAESPDGRSGMRDLLWALLNTKEFILNH